MGSVALNPSGCKSSASLRKSSTAREHTITDFERGASTMLAPNKARLCKVMESAGVIFDGSNGLCFAEPLGVESGDKVLR